MKLISYAAARLAVRILDAAAASKSKPRKAAAQPTPLMSAMGRYTTSPSEIAFCIKSPVASKDALQKDGPRCERATRLESASAVRQKAFEMDHALRQTELRERRTIW